MGPSDQAKRAPTQEGHRALLSTGEVAALLGCSRQHVVNLCERGVLACESPGVHRRIHRDEVAALRSGRGLTRAQLRSLWLHRVVAAKVIDDPLRARAVALVNLERMRAAHPRGPVLEILREWEQLVLGPPEALLATLTASSAHALELRQSSPFAGLLTDRERDRTLTSFAAAHPPS